MKSLVSWWADADEAPMEVPRLGRREEGQGREGGGELVGETG